MKIAVVGRLGIDLVAAVDRLPRPGETVPSRGFAREPGGTGTLQAIAAARLEGDVAVYGCVGLDPFGSEILALLTEERIHTEGVAKAQDAPTGASLVLVGPNRNYLAAHASGANEKLDEAYVERHLPRIREADAVLLDLALPVLALRALLGGLSSSCSVVASHPLLRDSAFPWEGVDYLVGTRDEFLQAGPSSGGLDDATRASQMFLDRGARNVVVVAGADGTYLVEKGGVTRFPGHGQPAADPSSTVDGFSAALAARLAAGRGLYEAVGFATAAIALSATRSSSGPASLPTSAEVVGFLARLSPHPGRSAA